MLREAEHILRQHMHQKEFWILTIKCGNKRKHENDLSVKIQNSFLCMC
jgi:hypothetical protein